MTNTCTCGTPTRDNAYVCENCLTLLANALGDVKWLEEQLEISITRQKGAGMTGGPNSGESALPWNEWASRAERQLRNALGGWVRVCEDSGVRNAGARNDLPADNLSSMATWMLWRVDGLAWHDFGTEVVHDITRAASEAFRCVTWKSEARKYLGSCDEPHPDDETLPCPGDVYAETDAEFGACDYCATPYPVQQRRDDMRKVLDDRLFTAAEIAGLSVHLGLDLPREVVRKRLNQWSRRDQIAVKGHTPEGDPTYRFGDVEVLLHKENKRRESA